MGDQLDAGQRTDAAAHVAFDERPAPEDRPQTGRGTSQLVAVDDPAQLPERVARGGAGGDHLTAEAGQQRFEVSAPPREQAVDVPALGDGSPLDARLGQRVAVEDRHPRVRLGERGRREQPAHASTDDDRVAAHHAALRFQAPIISGHMAACPPDSAASRARSSNHRSLCSSVVSPSARAPGRTLR